MPLSLLKQSLFALALALLAGSCHTLQNTAARFVPAGDQTFDATALPSGVYRLDPTHASLIFTFDHMGFSEVVASIDSFDAMLVFDNAEPGAARLSVTIDPASVDTNTPEFDKLLTGKDYFDVATFPEASFVSGHVYFVDEKTAEVPGTLAFHGVSNEVVLTVHFNGGARDWVNGGYRLGFSATGSLNRFAFGVKNLLALTGDEVKILISAEFILQEAQ